MGGSVGGEAAMMDGGVAIERWAPEQIAAESTAVGAIFLGAFAMLDEEAARYVANLAKHAERPDFRFIAARDRERGLLGFIYGYTGAPGQWFHDLLRRTLDPALVTRWLDGSFEVVEFAVRPEAQGRGIGGRLHNALLVGLANRTAILATDPSDTAAMRLYRGRGWQLLRDDYHFPDSDQPRAIMGRDLVAL